MDRRSSRRESVIADAEHGSDTDACAGHGALSLRRAMRKGTSICLYARASIALAGAFIAACAPERDFEPRVRNADAGNGRRALRNHECGVCHLIPGVPGAIGRVGPTLAAYSRFPYVAGK